MIPLRGARRARSFIPPATPSSRAPVSLADLTAYPVVPLAVAALAAVVAGVMNSIAGGGTLLTVPALIAVGLPPLTANATSTVALLPAALSSMLGYRGELAGARRWAVALAVPSLAGGGFGAFLLLHTSNETFERVVPWLVLGATALFLVQRPLLRHLRSRAEPSPIARDAEPDGPSPALLAAQFMVGAYGGYFGAGVGILMLAALGFMGFTNIHRMNGLKNWGGFCMNLVAAAMFARSGIVEWPIALSMAGGSIAGGYLGARGAQRLPPSLIRATVGVVGIGSGVWLMLR